MDIGITEDEFYDKSMAEIDRIFKSYSRKQKEELKRQARQNYSLANLIGTSVSVVLSENGKMPSINECYKGLFDEDITPQNGEQIDKNEIAFLQFAEQFNAKKEQGGITNK